MALAVGTRFGACEITGELGVGGMGEVYRATDTNLKRDVAIKVLPESFANDADRLARFQREAEVLASLNHTNIAQIYGLEKADEQTVIVMELVEGPTLADRIAEGPIAPDEALGIARQIADALEVAHGRQIVHRDLKPANIKLRADGAVKVLDFGIATAPESVTATSGRRSPTLLTPALTEAGVLLGTAGYMSPEQARGRAVDQRADIWAFGCVLYEMLTGQPAFAGEDVTTTLARVLEREANTAALPATLPVPVRHTIELCLEKDPAKRIADIRDVKLALAGRFESVAPAGTREAASARPAWRRPVPVGVAALALGAVVVGLAAWLLWPAAPPRPVNRFEYVLPQGQTLRCTGRPTMALSPDGRRFVYNTEGGLYLRAMGDLTAGPIPGTEELFCTPFFSPDGESVAYFAPSPTSSAGYVKRIAVSGGTAVVIADDVGNAYGASWGSDGTILYAERQPGGIFRVSANGGKPELIIPAKEGETLYGPELLPDGDSVLFSVTTTGNWEDADVVAQSLSTGNRTVLVKGGGDAHYVDGRLIYALGDALFGVAFDPKSLTVSGGAVPLVQGVMRSAGYSTAAADYAVSKDGTLVYASGTEAATARQLVWVDTEGHETSVPTPARAYNQVVLSPDGRHAALGISQDNAVWLSDLSRGTLERLPADLGDQEPSLLFFSADGQRVASSAVRDGQTAVVWQTIDGTGAAEPLVTFDASVTAVRAGALSPDGEQFVSTVVHDGNPDLGVVTVGDPTSYRDFLATPASEITVAISPDGRWIAYASNETGDYQVYVQRFPVGGGRLAASISGGGFPHWSADGKALTFMGLDRLTPVGIMRAPVTGLEGPDGSPTFGTPEELFPWKYYFATNGNPRFDMTADGERFLMIANESQDTESARFVVVTNWVQEMKRAVPTE